MRISAGTESLVPEPRPGADFLLQGQEQLKAKGYGGSSQKRAHFMAGSFCFIGVKGG